MIGKRVQADQYGWFNDKLNPGEYVFVNPTGMADGSPLPDWVKKHYPYWMCCSPNGHAGALGGHTVVEHEDGTITVSPSILIQTSRDGGKTMINLWHGFLERGIWRDA